MKIRISLLAIAILVAAFNVSAQTTEFTYQGQLQSSSTPGNGSFDFEFALFDTALGGSSNRVDKRPGWLPFCGMVKFKII